MKQINVYFDDKEHQQLVEKKGDNSWHDFIIEKCLDKIKKEDFDA